uniref:Uncharacterized protein n=1 Tax=Arundo donax TaxID=35708 RepID=A0A0A9EC52_ARUDO
MSPQWHTAAYFKSSANIYKCGLISLVKHPTKAVHFSCHISFLGFVSTFCLCT